MESGIREAVGILLPFVAHQLYCWLQSTPVAPAEFVDKEPFGHERVGAWDLEFEDEVLEEPEPEVAYPSCPLIDRIIYLVIGTGFIAPWVFVRVLLILLRSLFKPLSTPRRDVVIQAARTGDSTPAPPQPGRRQSY